MSYLEIGGGPFLIGGALTGGLDYFPPSQLYITFSLTVVLFSIVCAKVGSAQGESPGTLWVKMIRRHGAWAVIVSLLSVIQLETCLIVATIYQNSVTAQVALSFNAVVILIIFALMALWWWFNLGWQPQPTSQN